jgi:hypothetical protein
MFVKALVAEISSDERALRKRLERWMARFLKEVAVDQNNAFEIRFAKRFALAYAAGRLAIEYKVVPWSRSRVLKCIGRVYRRTVRQRRNRADAITDAAVKFLSELPRIAKHAPDRKNRTASNSPVLRAPGPEGETMLAIKRVHLTQLVGGKVSEKALAAHLEEMGALIPGTRGHRTRQLSVRGSKSRHRYYCFRLKTK